MNCKICGNILVSLGSIPFDTNNSGISIVSNTFVEYFKCNRCYSITCPEIMAWDTERMRSEIYNDKYELYDPDYKNGARAKDYGDFIKSLLPNYKGSHLDYGSGEGLLAKELTWSTVNYDPYSSTEKPSGLFKLITLIEVIEHTQDIEALLIDVLKYLDKRKGAIFFSTSLATHDTTVSWPYIAPRNGHINMQSQESLKILAIKHGMFFNSISENIHLLQSTRNNFKDLQRGTGW